MSKRNKVITVVMIAMMAVSVLAIGVSAAEGSTVSTDLSTFIDSIKGALADFTTTNLATILVTAVSLTAGLGIAWFAYRLIKGKVVSALKRGKIG